MALLASLATLGLSVSVRAAQPSARVTAALEWQVAEEDAGCMRQDEIQQGVQERLRRPVFVDAAAADVVLRAELTRDAQASGWNAVLELATRDGRRFGRRTLHTDKQACSALNDSLTLVVALLLDAPREELEREAGGPLVAPPPPSTPPKPPPSEPRRPPPPPPSNAWRFSTSALGVAALGLLPELGLGARVRFGAYAPSPFGLEIDATLWADAEASVGTRGSELSLASGALCVGALGVRLGPWSFGACAGVEVGRLQVTGFGLDENHDQTRMMLNLTGRGSISLGVVGPLAVRAGLGVVAPLMRDDFFFTASDGERSELFQMSPVVGSAEVGIGIDW